MISDSNDCEKSLLNDRPESREGFDMNESREMSSRPESREGMDRPESREGGEERRGRKKRKVCFFYIYETTSLP